MELTWSKQCGETRPDSWQISSTISFLSWVGNGTGLALSGAIYLENTRLPGGCYRTDSLLLLELFLNESSSGLRQNMSSSEFQSKMLVKFRRYKVGTVTYLYMFKDLGTNLDLFFPNEENQIANLYIPYIALAEAGNRNKRRQKGAGSATLTYHFRPISCLNFSGMGMG